MPIREYECAICGEVEEVLYLTFSEDDRAAVSEILSPRYCTVCGGESDRIVSVPGTPILLGEGFYKPSPQGKFHTVGPDPTKLAKEIGEEMGLDNILRNVGPPKKRRKQ